MQNILDFLNKYDALMSVVASVIVSYIVAKINAKNEIKKLNYTAHRDDKLLLDAAFSCLIATIDEWLGYSCLGTKNAALLANSKFIAIAPSRFHPLLLEIDSALNSKDIRLIQKLREQLVSLYSQQVQKSN